MSGLHPGRQIERSTSLTVLPAGKRMTTGQRLAAEASAAGTPDSGPRVSVNELFYSLQGEGTRAGRPCVFIRLMGCHLRCRYCDTAYAFYEGSRVAINRVVEAAASLGPGCDLYQVTGGEPLLQPGAGPLMQRLLDAGHTVTVETSGACDIDRCPPGVIRIMDLKTPGSGECERNDWGNVDRLTPRDEVKFVLCNRADFDWMLGVLEQHRLHERAGAVLVSAAAAMPAGPDIAGVEGLDPAELAEWLLDARPPVVFQTQLHKRVWPATMRGV